MAVVVVAVLALVIVTLTVEQRLRGDYRLLDREMTTGTDLGAPLPQAEPMPAPAPPAGDARPSPVVPAPGDGPAEPGTSVLFRGGPATGQWAQLGTVIEITRPDADDRAIDSYRMFWVDFGLPDELWDTLVSQVGLELAALGVPRTEPAFGVSERSNRLAAWGGRQYGTEHTGGRGIVAQFDAVADRGGEAVWTRWAFLVDPHEEAVVARMPRVEVTEADAATVGDATRALGDAVADWVGALGH